MAVINGFHGAYALWRRNFVRCITLNSSLTAARTCIAVVFALSLGWNASYAADFEALLEQAELGSVDAQFEVGTAYLTGTGTDKDPAEAASWLLKAARAGHVPAQYSLGDLYAAGRGVAADRLEAYFWFNIAARAGSEAAAKRRDVIGGQLTSSEFFGIQARIREWSARPSAPTPGRAAPSGARPASTSTGFVITPEGSTLTSAHSVRGCQSMTTQGAATGDATLLAIDAADMAKETANADVATQARLMGNVVARRHAPRLGFFEP